MAPTTLHGSRPSDSCARTARHLALCALDPGGARDASAGHHGSATACIAYTRCSMLSCCRLDGS